MMQDYNVYNMSLKERVFYISIAALVIFSVSFIFYRSIPIAAFFTPFALLYPRIKTKEIIKRRRKELNIQFKDMLYSLASSVSAGRTVESSFKEALRDLSVLYPDPSTYILVELKRIISGLDTNETIENALSSFAARAGLEDVNNFMNVLNISKRSGGSITEIIRSTSSIISDRIEVGQEIDMMLAERRFEQKVLNLMPILLILLLSFSAPEYMYPVFNTAAGRFTMTISIVLIAAAWIISARINDIRL